MVNFEIEEIRHFVFDKSLRLLTSRKQTIMKRLLKGTIGIILAAALLGVTSTEGAFMKGSKEADLSVSYSGLDAAGSDLDLLQISGSYGYLVTDSFSINAALSYMDVDLAGMSLDSTLLGVGIEYHFSPEGDLVPFAGVTFDFADINVGGLGDDEDWAWDVHLGVKQFLRENVIVKYQVGYIDFDDFDIDGVNVSVGLGFVF